MFPCLTRDDVFRLETRRLWLRWPKAADAAALAANRDAAETATAVPPPWLEGGAARLVERARAASASGEAIVLAMTRKEGMREVVGLVGLDAASGGALRLGLVVAPAWRGQGLGLEVARAMVGAGFVVTRAPAITVWTRREVDPACRRLLATCGFAPVGAEAGERPTRPVAVERFRLDRAAWEARRAA